jgi:hypothetical protein
LYPTAAELGVDLLNPGSSPVGPATCDGSAPGIELEGPQGAGICLAATPADDSGKVRVQPFVDGTPTGSSIMIEPCNVENVPFLRQYFTAESDDGTILYGDALPDVHTVVILSEDGRLPPIIAQTVALSARPGMTFWALREPTGWSPGLAHHFDASGSVVPTGEMDRPDACFPDGGPNLGSDRHG